MRLFLRFFKQSIPAIVALLGGIMVWQFVVKVFSVPSYLLPSPSVIVESIVVNFSILIQATSETALASFLGFLGASVVGVVAGIIFAESRLLERTLFPYFVIIQATPIIAIAPLIAIWFGNDLTGKVIMAGIIALFPVVVNTTVGLKRLSGDIRDLMQLYNSSRLKILIKASFPNALPHIFAGLRVSSTLSVVGAIVAELVIGNQGLGRFLLVSMYQFDIARLFAGVLGSILLGIGFLAVIKFIEKKAVFWRPSLNE